MDGKKIERRKEGWKEDRKKGRKKARKEKCRKEGKKEDRKMGRKKEGKERRKRADIHKKQSRYSPVEERADGYRVERFFSVAPSDVR